MNDALLPYFGQFLLMGDLGRDVTAVLTRHHLPKVAAHVARVAREAGQLANRFGADSDQVETAAWR